jgi:hypothetical protein
MNDIVAPSAGQIGRSLQRIEARAKVTGRAEYIHNLRLSGMLHAKTCCSTIPHGHIRHIDGAAAEAIAGVHRVVTGKDILAVIPDPYFGGLSRPADPGARQGVPCRRSSRSKASRRNCWLPTSDSPLEGEGFEPSVRRREDNVFFDSPVQFGNSPSTASFGTGTTGPVVAMAPTFLDGL